MNKIFYLFQVLEFLNVLLRTSATKLLLASINLDTGRILNRYNKKIKVTIRNCRSTIRKADKRKRAVCFQWTSHFFHQSSALENLQRIIRWSLHVFDYSCTLSRPAYFVHCYLKISAGYVKCYSILYLIFLLLFVSVESYFLFPLLKGACAGLFRPYCS